MIVRGELQESHRKRLASMDRSVHVHVMPLGALSSEGLRLFKDLARTFKRHNFYMAIRRDAQGPGVLRDFRVLGKQPNVHTWLIEGDCSGIEISRWHTRMEKGSSGHPKVGPRGDAEPG